MTAPLFRIALRTGILILSGVIGLHTVFASDELTLPSRVSAVRIPSHRTNEFPSPPSWRIQINIR